MFNRVLHIEEKKVFTIIDCSFLFLLKMFENTDSSDDNDDILSKQALPAADDSHGPVDLNKMPTTGEEYLRQVRYDE